jgi:hypothetical protein
MAILFDEYFRGIVDVNRLGYESKTPQFIPQEYLDKKFFILFRTCHSYGDWVIISSIPRFLKKKYSDCIVCVPSPKCIENLFSPHNWLDKSTDPFNNVVNVYQNNPYVDGMIDEIPTGLPVYHDHFRIYDLNESNIPLTEQMLKFWRFDPKEITDSAPELYWDDEEKYIGNQVIRDTFDKPFGFLFIDESFHEIAKCAYPPLDIKRKTLQSKINEFDNNIEWLYYAGKPISETCYTTKNRAVDVRSVGVSLRVQNYIKSKSKLVIGYQGGYGTDCMSRYTKCYVIPLNSGATGEHFIRTTEYIPHP